MMSGDAAGGCSRLAVVDDSAEFRQLVRAVAERIGWTVREFANGREFLASLTTGPHPNRVVLDLVMPEADGIETIGLMAATTLRCPVVLISGRQPLYAHAARKLGHAHGLDIAAVLPKPVGLEKLRATLDLTPTPGAC